MFKSVDETYEDLYQNYFMLRDDGDMEDVVFLYNSSRDEQYGPVHYIKSADYNGYVHCLGNGCPACAKGLRVEEKMMIPMYIPATNEIKFWDRNKNFHQQVMIPAVFNPYPDPSNLVFRITRRGAAGDRSTRYEIVFQGKLPQSINMETILANHNTKFPDIYERVVKSMDASEMSTMFSVSDGGTSRVTPADIDSMPEYKITPRTIVDVPAESTTPDIDSVAVGEDQVNF